MSIWNSILQASHSALLDELNEVFPDDKLELGLPKRFDGWGKPDSTDLFLIQEISTPEGKGVLLLGTGPAQDKKDNEKTFVAVIKRALKEFTIRKIPGNFEERLPKAPTLKMVIWLPIAIHQKGKTWNFDLGIGI